MVMVMVMVMTMVNCGEDRAEDSYTGVLTLMPVYRAYVISWGWFSWPRRRPDSQLKEVRRLEA